MSNLQLLTSCVALSTCAVAIKISANYTMCSWARLRAGVIRDTLYLDGGELWWQKAFVDGTTSDPTSDGNVEGDMYLLNFSQPFDAISMNVSNLFTPKQKAGGAANNIAPNYIDGTIFANDDELYLFGGLARSTNSSTPQDSNEILGFEAFQYGVQRESWSPGFYQGTLTPGVTRYITNGAGVSAPSENLGFYFSGMRASDWGPIDYDTNFAETPANTLIEVDMSVMRDEQWKNTTLPSEIVPRANAELVWLPVSDRGVLIAIGGVVAPEEIWPYGLNSSQEAQSKAISPKFMTTVSVYDISLERWYLQNTTGTAPNQLTEFCSVVAVANDSSSFNIYIYGGYDGLNSVDMPSDDVWILSVPAFHWIKAYSGQTSSGRSGHRCVSPYPDQMFIVGGVHQSQAFCVGGIIRIFNLNTLEFQDTYDPETWTPYHVPDIVTSVIGGNGQGGASKTAEWSDDSLGNIFRSKYPGKVARYYPYPLASNITMTGPERRPSNKTWIAPVLGSVLGLVVLGIIAFAILCARRRKQSHRNTSVCDGLASGSSSKYLRWVNGISPAIHEQKIESSLTSSEALVRPSGQSNPSTENPIPSPLASELNGRPMYEMSAAPRPQSVKPPVELPTPYHDQKPLLIARSIDYAGIRAPTEKLISNLSAYESSSNYSSPFSPDDVNRDSAISHGEASDFSSIASNNSPLLSPARWSRVDDDVPPVPLIPRHMRQISSRSSGIVSPLTPADDGKATFNFG